MGAHRNIFFGILALSNVFTYFKQSCLQLLTYFKVSCITKFHSDEKLICFWLEILLRTIPQGYFVKDLCVFPFYIFIYINIHNCNSPSSESFRCIFIFSVVLNWPSAFPIVTILFPGTVEDSRSVSQSTLHHRCMQPSLALHLCSLMNKMNLNWRRSQWPQSEVWVLVAWILGSRVQIPLKALMFVLVFLYYAVLWR
jgi:hypothetical protein